MHDAKTPAACLACDRPDSEVPVIRVRYLGARGWICADCLPHLIHDRAQLTARLAALAAGKPETVTIG